MGPCDICIIIFYMAHYTGNQAENEYEIEISFSKVKLSSFQFENVVLIFSSFPFCPWIG